MRDKRTHRKNISIAFLIMVIQSLTFSALVGEAANGTKPLSLASTSGVFTKPTANFDFSSMVDRASAAKAMDATRSNWGSFFKQRTKPVFTEELTNVVKGSGNDLRGTQNEIEGQNNKLTGAQNSLFGD